METSHTYAIERIARVLAGRRLSDKADGAEASASRSVDATWSTFIDDAVAVLKTLREPDAVMAAVGDAHAWSSMIAAALGELPRSDVRTATPSVEAGAISASDAPPEVVDEIFGASATTSSEPAGRPTLLAVLTDGAEGLRLTLGSADDGSSQGVSSRTRLVADVAEADRVINGILQAKPGSQVVRAGDGWTTHPE